MDNIKDLINKYKLDIANKQITYMVSADLMCDWTNEDNEGRDIFDITEGGKYAIETAEEYEKDGFAVIDIDPAFVFLGVCDVYYVYGVLDRFVLQNNDGAISQPIIKRKTLVDVHEDGTAWTTNDGVYVSAKIIEELPYMNLTFTSDITPIGKMYDSKELSLRNDKTYEKMDGYRLCMYPCGEDEENIYSYAVHVGNMSLNRDDGVQTVYGSFLSTVPSGQILLIRIPKSSVVVKQVEANDHVDVAEVADGGPGASNN